MSRAASAAVDAGVTPKPSGLDVGGAADAAASAPLSAPASSVSASGKRRRGAVVDYAAMDLKLRQEEALARRKLQEERLLALDAIQLE